MLLRPWLGADFAPCRLSLSQPRGVSSKTKSESWDCETVADIRAMRVAPESESTDAERVREGDNVSPEVVDRACSWIVGSFAGSMAAMIQQEDAEAG